MHVFYLTQQVQGRSWSMYGYFVGWVVGVGCYYVGDGEGGWLVGWIVGCCFVLEMEEEEEGAVHLSCSELGEVRPLLVAVASQCANPIVSRPTLNLTKCSSFHCCLVRS